VPINQPYKERIREKYVWLFTNNGGKGLFITKVKKETIIFWLYEFWIYPNYIIYYMIKYSFLKTENS